MYYSPPKRSCWGHSLRKMQPAVQRERLNQFLAKSVGEYALATGSIFYLPSPGGALKSETFDTHFMRLLHTTAAQPTFSKLTDEQFELCLHELLASPELYESGRHGANVVAYYTIKAWNIAGVKVETNSGLGVYYGAKAIIVPEFSFETMDIFEYLRDSLKSAGLCQLNPKHIKTG